MPLLESLAGTLGICFLVKQRSRQKLFGQIGATNPGDNSSADPAPLDVVGSAWQRSLIHEDGGINVGAYTFCTLDRLATAIHRRDMFTRRSWRYADPRANLLKAEWKVMRSVVCHSLGWSPRPTPVLDALSRELDRTYRDVAKRLSKNPDVRFETVDGKKELILTLGQIEAR